MNTENQIIDYKSIRKIRTGDKGFKDLAVSCIAFANAQGGTLYIGIEDKSLIPLAGQTITEEEINYTVSRLHSLCFNVSLSSSGLIKHENGGVYFKISVAPSLKSIATTSDGKIYIRIADKCELQSTKLSAYLQLSDDERLRSYVEPLLKDGIISKKGTKKGTTYFINPKLIANSNANIKTSLRTIEPYTLKALILEDLKYHPQSLISEIAERLPDVERVELQKMLYSMVGNEIKTTGGRTYRKYELK